MPHERAYFIYYYFLRAGLTQCRQCRDDDAEAGRCDCDDAGNWLRMMGDAYTYTPL